MATVLGYFDMDQKFMAFGFGAKLSKKESVHYCFPLNKNSDDPSVVGVKVRKLSYQMIPVLWVQR